MKANRYRYFCAECGCRFESDKPEFAPWVQPNGAPLPNPDLECPECGCACVYLDNERGHREELDDFSASEAAVEGWAADMEREIMR